ncbi:C6 zinc finger domain-protein [Cladorrhinum sp. PSN332]|nr:C6 zinc finger domain-protein [Cladorrhinum sp. PSN332]
MTSMERRRHCWECLRRSLVCDSTRPTCSRCSSSGTQCPGYGHVKPQRLRWLSPGAVKSRKKRSKEIEPLHVPSPSVTPRFQLTTELCAVFQAAQYFNTCIYQDLIPVSHLGKNQYIYLISPAQIQNATHAPDYLRLGMVCMTLSHRVNRLGADPGSRTLVERFYSYRGTALRSLREHLDHEPHRATDLAVVGVLTLLLTEIQHSLTPVWRPHLDAARKLLNLRGGFHALAGSPSLEGPMLSLWYMAIISNTTSPSSCLSMTSSHLASIEFLTEYYANSPTPFQLCPLSLLGEIIRINHLRMLAFRSGDSDLVLLAEEVRIVLERVKGFSPGLWAGSKSSAKTEWEVVGSAYQAAVGIYSVLAMQSLGVLPVSGEWSVECEMLARRLKEVLKAGLGSRRVNRFLLWPLVVLGVRAVDESLETKSFVGAELEKLSCDIGTCTPLAAKRILETFWARGGESGWEGCFESQGGYLFTTQIAVDTSRVDVKGTAPVSRENLEKVMLPPGCQWLVAQKRLSE